MCEVNTSQHDTIEKQCKSFVKFCDVMLLASYRKFCESYYILTKVVNVVDAPITCYVVLKGLSMKPMVSSSII